MARYLVNRYAEANGGLRVRRDSMDAVRQLVASLPQDRVSRNPIGRTVVTVRLGDRPSAVHAQTGDAHDRAYNAQGVSSIDVQQLFENIAQRGLAREIAIKARNHPDPGGPVPRLCWSETNRFGRTSIYVPSGIQDPHQAGLAALQLLDELNRHATRPPPGEPPPVLGFDDALPGIRLALGATGGTPEQSQAAQAYADRLANVELQFRLENFAAVREAAFEIQDQVEIDAEAGRISEAQYLSIGKQLQTVFRRVPNQRPAANHPASGE